MGEIADDETLLVKVLNFVKGLKSTQKSKNETSESGWANRFSGAWKDSRTAEEIINDIRESRTDIRLKKAGNPIEDFDLLIGCAAKAAGLTMVTHNTKHFNHIEGLDIEDWFK